MENRRKIKVYDIRTWPMDIKKFFTNQIDYCYDGKFEKLIKQYDIVGYHHTKILDLDNFLKHGLRFLNNTTIDILKNNIIKITGEDISVISNKIDKYLEENDYDHRYELLFFGLTNKNINSGYDWIFNYYGGEITYNSLPDYHEYLLKSGTPCIIEFVFKYEFLNCYMKEYIYKMMLTKFKENRIVEMDFCLKRCIPKECILSIRKIKDLDGEYIKDEILYKV